MRIKSISIGDKGKKLSISWYSGEDDNTLNTVSGTDKPLPSFKEAWDALAAEQAADQAADAENAERPVKGRKKGGK